jgi:Fe-S oxidoreductase
MSRQKADSAMLAQLQEEYQYDGIETCAGDGMCSTVCPIGINTGTCKRVTNNPNKPREIINQVDGSGVGK